MYIPTLLLDEQKCRRNIASMAEKARKHGLFFRPHFKTHQSAEIGEWFRAEGVTGITVSSLSMAAYFAQHGWEDITVAFSCNVLEINQINALAAKVRLGILVESLSVLQYLHEKLQHPVCIWIKIDSGYHRTGIEPHETDLLDGLMDFLRNNSPKLVFKGLLTHSGHSYKARSMAEIKAIHQHSIKAMLGLWKRYNALFPNMLLSVGDTPTCSLMEEWEGVNEMRVGNFAFYDAMQHNIGSCTEQQVAVAVACPVVAKHLKRRQIVIYGGAVHLSKDKFVLPDGSDCFGRVAQYNPQGGWHWLPLPNRVVALSQEHGVVELEPSYWEQYKEGDSLLVIPAHSCLTADLYANYQTLDGKLISKFFLP